MTEVHGAHSKILSLVLSFVLALSCYAPGSAWADSQGYHIGTSDAFVPALEIKVQSAADQLIAQMKNVRVLLFTMSKKAKDLNALWKAQSGGTDAAFTITEEGTYKLTADLETHGTLIVNATGGPVTILLQGYTFTCHEASMGVALRFSRNVDVTVDGTSIKDTSAIIYEGGQTPVAVRSEAKSATLNNLRIESHTDSEHRSLTRYDARGVQAQAGDLKMTSCVIDVDLSNQSNASVDGSKFLKESPSGIYLERGIDSATIEDCSVTCTNSPLVVRSKYNDDTAGYAYALYSLAQKNVTIRGGSFSAVCGRGNATAMRLTAADLQPGTSKSKSATDSPIKVSSNAGETAVGIQGVSASGVKLNAPIEFDFGDEYVSALSAGLYAPNGNAFVFGTAFSTSEASVLVDVANGASNDTGAIIGSVSEGTAQGQAEKVLGSLINAYGASAPTYPALEGSSIIFALDESKAPAEIASTDGNTIQKYSSVVAAISNLENGQTVRLLADADDIDFSSNLADGSSVKLDLNGYASKAIRVVTNADVQITSNAKRTTITGGLSGYGVYYKGAGTLKMSGIDISCCSPTVSTNALYIDGSGTVNLDDVNIEAVSEQGVARGVYLNAVSASMSASGGSISAATNTPGVIVHGVATTNQTNMVSLVGCPISVEGVTGNTGGFYGRGSFVLRPNSQGNGSRINVSTVGAATSAWGVCMTSISGATSRAVLEDATISVTSQVQVDSKPYWCLLSGEANPSSAVEWTFEGSTLSLSSENDTHIGQYGVSIKAASGLQLANPVTLFSANLENNVAIESLSGGTVSALADSIKPAQGSMYEGWSLKQASNGALSWQRAHMITNTSSGKGYEMLQPALDGAADGDVLKLLDDCTVEGPIEIASSIRLDVAGHELKVKGDQANAKNAGDGAALVFSGTGSLCLADSSQSSTGCVRLLLGREGETSVTASTPYQGICVSNGGTLKVDCCHVEAVYNGTSSSDPEVVVRAIAILRGSAMLENGARLTVKSCESGASFGACSATGVYLYDDASKEGAPTASVDASSSVVVEGISPSFDKGSVIYSERTAVARFERYDLRRIDIDEGSDLYQQVLEKFKQEAKLDSSLESTSTYNAGIYYAVPIKLDEGAYVWAYSQPCPANRIGEPDAIMPALFFMQSKHSIVCDAVGLTASSAFSGSVDVKGSVSATSLQGDAICVDVRGAGEWKLDGSVLSAHAGSGSRDVISSKLDLCDYLDIPVRTERVTYPQGSTQKVAESRAVRAYGVWTGDADSSSVIGGTPRVSAEGADAQQVAHEGVAVDEPPRVSNVSDLKPRVNELTVTFRNLRTTTGAMKEDRVVSAVFGEPLSEESIPQQGSYNKNGSTFRFVGWSPSINSTFDPRSMKSIAIDSTIAGATTGSVTLDAVYVEVAPKQKLVEFRVDNNLTAYAANVGDIPSFAEANAGSARHIPKGETSSDAIKATFKGWVEGWHESSDLSGEGSCITGGLPRVSEDVVYTASFAREPDLRSLVFYYWMVSDGSAVYASPNDVQVLQGSDPTPVARTYASIGDVVSADDLKYEFQGWSVRKSDKKPVFADELPEMALEDPDAVVVYYGIYDTLGVTYDINFIVKKKTMASLRGASGSQTIDSAFRTTGAETPTAPEGYRFSGWGLTATDSKRLSGALVSIADAYGRTGASDHVLNLYALFVKKGEAPVNGGSVLPSEPTRSDTESTDTGPSESSSSNSSSTGSSSGSNAVSIARPAATAISPGGASAVTRSATGVAAVRSSDAVTLSSSANAGANASEGSTSLLEESITTGAFDDQDGTGSISDPGNVAVFYASVIAVVGLIVFAFWSLFFGRRRRRAEDLADEPAASADQAQKELVSF